MSKHRFLLFAIILLAIISSCKLFDKESKDKDVLGCTDEAAHNYDPEATKDDGSCDYCTGELNSSFLLMTYDGGLTWVRKCFNIPIGEIFDISIVDSNNIWVVTSPSLQINKAQILHTDNGGYTWTEQYEDTDNNDFFNYIEMFDENNGIAMGDGKDFFPLFLKTTDSGVTWTKITTQRLGLSADTWRKIDFVDINTGYYKGAIPSTWGDLYKTKDSGNTWSILDYPDSTNIWVLKFFNEDIGLMSVGYNELLRTTDSGQSWEAQEIDWGENARWALDIVFNPADPNQVWIGASTVFYSYDMGLTWTEQTLSNEPIKIWNMYVGENSVWAAGYWKDKELFVNRDINQNTWEQIQLPLDDNMPLKGIIDGVGDNIIVLPGSYYQ